MPEINDAMVRAEREKPREATDMIYFACCDKEYQRSDCFVTERSDGWAVCDICEDVIYGEGLICPGPNCKDPERVVRHHDRFCWWGELD